MLLLPVQEAARIHKMKPGTMGKEVMQHFRLLIYSGLQAVLADRRPQMCVYPYFSKFATLIVCTEQQRQYKHLLQNPSHIVATIIFRELPS